MNYYDRSRAGSNGQKALSSLTQNDGRFLFEEWKETFMKTKVSLALFFPLILICWPLPGCKNSAIESEIFSYTGKIAFTSYRDSGEEIYIMDIDGNNQYRLTNNIGRDEDIVFSPDGVCIAFTSLRDEDLEICKIDISNNDLVNLTHTIGSDAAPIFSLDGLNIAFLSDRDGNREIYVMDINGSNQDPRRTLNQGFYNLLF